MARIRLELDTLTITDPEIEASISGALRRATEKGIDFVEIILLPGYIMDPNTDRFKKFILRFLARPDIACQYFKLEKGDKNSGRLLIRFRHKRLSSYHH